MTMREFIKMRQRLLSDVQKKMPKSTRKGGCMKSINGLYVTPKRLYVKDEIKAGRITPIKGSIPDDWNHLERAVQGTRGPEYYENIHVGSQRSSF